MSSIMGQDIAVESVSLAAAGDREAFSRIVARYHNDMVRVAYLVTADAEIAQDAAQAGWAIAWRKLRGLRDPDRLRAWLVSVAANEARHMVRRAPRGRGREAWVDPSFEVDRTAPDGWADETERLDLLDALQRLPEVDRTIVAMRFGLGMNSDEIGAVVGLRPSGVRARLARALGRLRRELRDD